MAYKQSMGNSKRISLDDVCYLVSTTFKYDELMQQIEVKSEREVFCSVLSINRFEYNQASLNGSKPSLTFVLNYEDYNDETAIKYNDKMYHVYRTFVKYDGHIELHSEVRVGVN